MRLGDALLLKGRGLDTPGIEVTVAGRPCARDSGRIDPAAELENARKASNPLE